MSDLEFPLKCAVCGKPASCFGRYEDQTGPVEPACDECCGHGCEDGWCVQIDSCSDLIAEFASVRAELDKATTQSTKEAK